MNSWLLIVLNSLFLLGSCVLACWCSPLETMWLWSQCAPYSCTSACLPCTLMSRRHTRRPCVHLPPHMSSLPRASRALCLPSWVDTWPATPSCGYTRSCGAVWWLSCLWLPCAWGMKLQGEVQVHTSSRFNMYRAVYLFVLLEVEIITLLAINHIKLRLLMQQCMHT